VCGTAAIKQTSSANFSHPIPVTQAFIPAKPAPPLRSSGGFFTLKYPGNDLFGFSVAVLVFVDITIIVSAVSQCFACSTKMTNTFWHRSVFSKALVMLLLVAQTAFFVPGVRVAASERVVLSIVLQAAAIQTTLCCPTSTPGPSGGKITLQFPMGRYGDVIISPSHGIAGKTNATLAIPFVSVTSAIVSGGTITLMHPFNLFASPVAPVVTVVPAGASSYLGLNIACGAHSSMAVVPSTSGATINASAAAITVQKPAASGLNLVFLTVIGLSLLVAGMFAQIVSLPLFNAMLYSTVRAPPFCLLRLLFQQVVHIEYNCLSEITPKASSDTDLLSRSLHARYSQGYAACFGVFPYCVVYADVQHAAH